MPKIFLYFAPGKYFYEIKRIIILKINKWSSNKYMLVLSKFAIEVRVKGMLLGSKKSYLFGQQK